ncbi:MAG TPA: MBL fold metallo-hydrolase [Nitrososphaerales archaeon]|nr:MBL fold metallo-hydrolase [Nitrososphaerales archaeon]
MFEAILLGTGDGKADPKRFAPSNVVFVNDNPVLVDAGPGVNYQLRKAGLRPGEIKQLFLTHFHADHFYGYPWLLYEPIVAETDFERGVLKFYGPPGARRKLRALNDAFEPGIDIAAIAGYGTIEKYFEPEVTEIYNGWTLDLEAGCKVRACLGDHGECKLPCFCFRFETGSKSIVFTGDTVGCENLIELARGADVLVHECNFPEEEVATRRKLGFAWWIHSTPTMAGKLAKAAGVKKLVLNHFVGWNDFTPNKDPYDWEKIAPPRVKENFDGELILGEDLMKIEI